MSNSNETTAGTWGLYPWFEEHGAELVHSDDIDEFRKLSPYGKVFLRTGEDNGFIRLAYGDRTFHVKPDLFQPVPRSHSRSARTSRFAARMSTQWSIRFSGTIVTPSPSTTFVEMGSPIHAAIRAKT